MLVASFRSAQPAGTILSSAFGTVSAIMLHHSFIHGQISGLRKLQGCSAMHKLHGMGTTGAVSHYTSSSATPASVVAAKCKASEKSSDGAMCPSIDSVPVDNFKTPGAVVSGIYEGHEKVRPSQCLSWKRDYVNSSLYCSDLSTTSLLRAYTYCIQWFS